LGRQIIGLPTYNAFDGRSEYAVRKAYCDAIAAASAIPLLLPLLTNEDLLWETYGLLDGLLLCGGGDVAAEHYGGADSGRLTFVDSERDRVELTLTRWALRDRLPVLGICRGIQLLNVAAGGTLIQDIPSECPGALKHRSRRRSAHDVTVQPGTLLAGFLAPGESLGKELRIAVNSRHHQAVRKVAPRFIASAYAPDGIIEGIEVASKEDGFAVGVQWHAENLVPEAPEMVNLFRRFVETCQRRGCDNEYQSATKSCRCPSRGV